MKRNLWWGLAGTALLAGAFAVGQTPRPQPNPPAEGPGQPAAKADRGKYIAELPTETVVGAGSAPADANPKVQPGKVQWHADLETACKAAGQSGKPVLVFHMMGKLDDRFC